MVIACIAMMLSCDKQITSHSVKSSKADSVIFGAGAVMDYERLRALTDSFETTGDISPLNANRW
jgi:hypothetical protein